MLPLQFLNKRLLVSLITIIGSLLFFSIGSDQIKAASANPPVVSSKTAAATDGPSGYIGVYRLNVRAGPGTNYPILAVAQYKEVVSLTGRNAALTWLQIRRADGQQGWVYAPFVVASAAHLSALPILDGTPPTPVPPPPTEPAGHVTAYRLNVRTGPSLNDSRLAVLNRGQMIVLIGRNTTNTWLQIKLPDDTPGWVSARYIQSNVPIETLPVTGGEVPNPIPEVAGQVTAYKLNVRSGPGINYGIMGWLYQGDHVWVLGRSEDARWLKIEIAVNYQGWVSARYLQLTMPVTSLPVLQFSQ